MSSTAIRLGLLVSCLALGAVLTAHAAKPNARSNPKRKQKAVLPAQAITTPELLEVDRAEALLKDASEQMLSEVDRALQAERQAIGKVRTKRQYIKRKDYAYKTLAYLQGKEDLTPPKRKYKSNRVPRTFRVPYEIGGHTFYQYYKL